MSKDESAASFRRYADLARRVPGRIEDQQADDLQVHLGVWRSLAAKQGRELTLDDDRKIRRNLGAL